MKKIVLACSMLGLLGILGAMGVGCGGNACEAAGDTIEAKYGECGKELPTSTASGTAECTEAAGKLAQCTADCFAAASCDCTGLGDIMKCDMADLMAYSDCSAKCQ
jgi:hypothetical protein